MHINPLFWLLPAVICVMAEVWFGVRSLGRDETDPDSYEIHEQWFVLVLGIVCTAGAIALGAAAACSDLLEGEGPVVEMMVAVVYLLLLSGGTYCVGSYFARRVTVTRQSVTYRNMAGVRGVWYLDQIYRVETGIETAYGSTIRALGADGKVLFKVETNMKNAGRFLKDMKKYGKTR